MAHSPQTGYTIKKWIENEYSYFWQESYGQIYPTLKKLVAEGYANCEPEAKFENGRGQIIYQITDAGRLELTNWLKKEPQIEKLRYEILLKISFGKNAETQTLLTHLDEFKTRNKRLVQEMNSYMVQMDERSEEVECFYSQLTALCGVYVYSAMEKWAEEAKRRILERNNEKNE
ncbi:PadR family transcriptional regulator [Clostridium merdae]|uniref:PadR family transcriptional regulator n=1 Tax=Clostridium merdae TaxID=1958780 RepID=UPI001FA9069E|nr:PadR family transcriptional regulator [Clostridium merdae]